MAKSADLYGDGRDDLAILLRKRNYASLTTSNSITSEFINWNNSSKIIKGLLVNTKNANTFTGKQGKV